MKNTLRKHAWAVGMHPVPQTLFSRLGKLTHFEGHALVYEQSYSLWKVKCSSFSNIRACPSMWVTTVTIKKMQSSPTWTTCHDCACKCDPASLPGSGSSLWKRTHHTPEHTTRQNTPHARTHHTPEHTTRQNTPHARTHHTPEHTTRQNTPHARTHHTPEHTTRQNTPHARTHHARTHHTPEHTTRQNTPHARLLLFALAFSSLSSIPSSYEGRKKTEKDVTADRQSACWKKEKILPEKRRRKYKHITMVTMPCTLKIEIYNGVYKCVQWELEHSSSILK